MRRLETRFSFLHEKLTKFSSERKQFCRQIYLSSQFLPPVSKNASSKCLFLSFLRRSTRKKKRYIASTQSQFASTRNEAVTLPARLSKLKLAEFSGDPLEWPEWSGLFLSTVHAANIDTSLKMNHLKTLVTRKAKEVIAGLRYTGDMYDIAWNTLVAHFGRPQVVVNEQMGRIYTFPPVKAYDSVALSNTRE